MKQTLTIRPPFECVRAEQLSRKPSAFFDDISKQNKAMIVETDGGGRVLVMPAEWMEPFNDPNMHLIVIGALRYSMGRMTYMPKVTCDFIKRHMTLWNENTLSILIRDIREHLTDYAEHEPYPETWYGLQLALEARLNELKGELK